MYRISLRNILSFSSLLWISFTVPVSVVAQDYKVISARIDYAHPAKTMEGFGASDAWTCQFAGLWPDSQKTKIADLLFSTRLDKSGNPLGIGLNFWRFAIGGGSEEQGASSGIRDEWRRQMSFLKLNGQYEENAMPGQIWFMNAAKDRGVKKFLGFVNSPHVNFTLNHKAFSSDGKCNLDFGKLDGFTSDLVKNIQIIKAKTGVELDYLSPVNEPQWKWNEGKQEGCPYTNLQMVDLVKDVSKALIQAKLKTKIQIGDAGQLNYLTNHLDSAKSIQIDYFFNRNSSGYLGDLNNLDRSISAHSYFTTSPEQKAINIRKTLKAEVAKHEGLRFWMSEYCVLGDSLLKGEGRDLGMTTALFIAKLIHHDLDYANATSWQWWLAVSTENYKDGLVYIDKSKTNGQVFDSKLLWGFGNYSRFIPEGSIRIPVVTADEKDFYISGFLNNNEITTVAVNNSEQAVKLELSGVDEKQKEVTLYTTSSLYNLQKSVSLAKHIVLPAKSITTIIGKSGK